MADEDVLRALAAETDACVARMQAAALRLQQMAQDNVAKLQQGNQEMRARLGRPAAPG